MESFVVSERLMLFMVGSWYFLIVKGGFKDSRVLRGSRAHKILLLAPKLLYRLSEELLVFMVNPWNHLLWYLESGVNDSSLT